MSSTKPFSLSSLDNDVLRVVAQYLNIQEVYLTFLHVNNEFAHRVQPNWFSDSSLILTLSVAHAMDQSPRLARLLASVRCVTVLPPRLPPTCLPRDGAIQASIDEYDTTSTRTLLDAIIRFFHTIKQLTLHRVDRDAYLQWEYDINSNQPHFLHALRHLNLSFALKFRLPVVPTAAADFLTRDWMLSGSLQSISLRGYTIQASHFEALLSVPNLRNFDLRHASCRVPDDFDLCAVFARHIMAIRKLHVFHLPAMQREDMWGGSCNQLQALCAALPELAMDPNISSSTFSSSSSSSSSLQWTSFQGSDDNLQASHLSNIFALPTLQWLQLWGQTVQDFRTVFNALIPPHPLVDGQLPSLAQSRLKHLHFSLRMPVSHERDDPLADSDLLVMFLCHSSALMTLDLTLPHGVLWNDSVCDTILTQMSQLQSLRIAGPYSDELDMFVPNTDIDQFVALHSSLQCHSSALLLPSLRVMEFFRMKITDKQLILLLARSPGLRDVLLEKCASLSVLILFAFAQYSHRLARLHVETCSNVRLLQEDIQKCEMQMITILSFLPAAMSAPLTELIHFHMQFSSMHSLADPTVVYAQEIDAFGLQWLASDLLVHSPLKYIGLASVHLRDSHILSLGALQCLEVLYWPQLREQHQRGNGYARAKHLYDEGLMCPDQPFTTSAESQMFVTNAALLHVDDLEGADVTPDGISFSFLQQCSYYGYREFAKHQHHQHQYPCFASHPESQISAGNQSTRTAYFDALTLIVHSDVTS